MSNEFTEIDRELDQIRDEATKQLRAAGLPENVRVEVWLQRHHDRTDGIVGSYSVWLCGGDIWNSGQCCDTPKQAIAAVVKWWNGHRVEIAEKAEYEEWKRVRSQVAEVI
jgi:hypothetical protein